MTDPTANENVDLDDIKATAQAKAEDVKAKLDDIADRFDSLNLNRKLLLVGAASVVASVVISRVVSKFREVQVDGDLVVIEGEKVSQ